MLYYFIPISLIAVAGKETLNFASFSEVSQIFPHFTLKSTKQEVKSPYFY